MAYKVQVRVISPSAGSELIQRTRRKAATVKLP